VKIEVLPSKSEHHPFILSHQKEIAMGILVIRNKRYMRAMAKPEGIFTEAFSCIININDGAFLLLRACVVTDSKLGFGQSFC